LIFTQISACLDFFKWTQVSLLYDLPSLGFAALLCKAERGEVIFQ